LSANRSTPLKTASQSFYEGRHSISHSAGLLREDIQLIMVYISATEIFEKKNNN